MVPRLLLISDGNENLGSVARAIWQAQQLGVPIDTVALAGRPKPGLRLESVTIPGQVFSGERFPIDVAVEAPGAAHARVELTAEGKTIGSSDVDLASGVNHLRLQASVNTVGAVALAGKIAATDLGEARFEDSVTLRSPRVLLVSRDPAASEEHIIRALHANQFEVQQAPGGVPPKIDDFQLVVINNWDMESIPATAKASLEDYVKKGGGLVWIAGEHNVYVDKKGKPEDALERSLPAKLAPPRSPEGTAVVLIIDKSSSMEGRKIELARLAAIGVVENLRPIDSVGVLIFDNSFQWAVPIRKAEDRATIKKLIAGITPDGGTQIAPGAHRGVPANPAADGDVQAHRAADRRYFRRGRQHDAHQGSAGQSRDHLHGRAGAGRESRVSGEGGVERGRQIVLPERPLRPGTDPAARRGRAHRRDGGGEGDHAEGDQAGGDSGWRGDGERAAVERLRAFPVAAHVGHHPDGGPRRSAAGALAVRAGPHRGVHQRRQEPLGGQLGAMAGLRQALGQHLPRPAAARAAERNHGGFRPRERRTGGGLPALAQCRGTGQDAGYFRAWARTGSTRR